MKSKITFLFLFLSGFVAIGQEVSVSFSVNMTYQMTLGNFDPDNEFVDIAGTFNGWGDDLSPLQDMDGDGIYSITIDGLIEGETVEFKFRQNGLWDGTEEFPGVGNNRVYTVDSNNAVLDFWYNNELPPTGPAQAFFAVDNTKAYEHAILTFEDQSAGNVEFIEWYFEGGQPEVTADPFVPIRYDNPGFYDVRLIAGNSNGSDTLLLEDYIEIKERNLDTPWWNETVFYEIFVRSFYDSDGDGVGDFNGMTEKLDYLNDGNPNTTDDLGITGIWLMPIHESPSYHGYDVTDYKSVNSDYGSMADFQNFLDEAHARGIKVIIDFVMNHSSTQHPWFQDAMTGPNAEKRNYYRWSDTDPGYNGPWGQEVWHNSSSGYYYGLFWGGMPDLNYEEPELKAEIFDAADFWLEEIGIDGFRLDAVKYIYEDGSQLEDTPATLQFWKDFRAHYEQVNPEAFTVGEAWTYTDKVVQYVEEDKLDYCFEFDLASAMLYTINENMNTDWLSYQAQKVYNVYPHLQYGTFLTNHDQDRMKDVLGNSTSKIKSAAALYLTMPGIPYLYYGEEVGMNGTKPDPNIRRPMQWDDSDNAGFTTGNPWQNINNNYALYNVADGQVDPESIWSWYQRLIQVRNEQAALRTGSYEAVSTNIPELFAFARVLGDETILVLVNTGNQDLDDIELDLNYVNLAPQDYGLLNLIHGSHVTNITLNPDNTISELSLGSRGVRIYKFTETNVINEVASDLDIRVYPNPAQDFVEVYLPEGETVNLELLDVQGKRMQTNQASGYLELDLDNFAPGLYYLRITGENWTSVKKLVKQ